MLQAAFLDCLFLDLFPFSDDGLVAPKIDVGWRDVVQALVVALVVVVIYKCPDLAFKIAGQVVVFQQTLFFMVWCQRSILPWVCGWNGAPRT